MGEICEVCGRISVATYGLGIPGTPIDKVCFRMKAGADTTCYVIGYERASEALAAANARAEAAEAEAEAQHARWCREVIDHCPHPTDEAVCCSDCLAAALGALAAARRECEGLRKALEEYVQDSDVSLDSIERVASEFLAATGYLAPGKDIPAAMDSDAYREERRQRWNEWVRKKLDARFARARAALAAPAAGEEGKR